MGPAADPPDRNRLRPVGIHPRGRFRRLAAAVIGGPRRSSSGAIALRLRAAGYDVSGIACRLSDWGHARPGHSNLIRTERVFNSESFSLPLCPRRDTPGSRRSSRRVARASRRARDEESRSTTGATAGHPSASALRMGAATLRRSAAFRWHVARAPASRSSTPPAVQPRSFAGCCAAGRGGGERGRRAIRRRAALAGGRRPAPRLHLASRGGADALADVP